MILESQVFSNIVGSFRDELEHRMHLQDLDIRMDDLRFEGCGWQRFLRDSEAGVSSE